MAYTGFSPTTKSDGIRRIHAETADQVETRSWIRLTKTPQRRCAPIVAGFAWSGWQLSRGPRGSVHVDWVAGFTWTEWQPSHGLGGRHPWNMQSRHDSVKFFRIRSGYLSSPEAQHISSVWRSV